MELLQALKPQDLKNALESIGETESKLNNYKLLVKDWMKCQPHLPSEKYVQDIIDIFIRGCTFNLERVKAGYLLHGSNHKFRTLRRLESVTVLPLPIPLPNGYRVILHKYLTSDRSSFIYKDIVTLMLMVGDIRLKEEQPILGDIFIFDVANFSAGHLRKITIPLLKKAMHCIQNAYPQRLKEIHIVNSPVIVDKLTGLFKQFMKEKMRDRFYIHSKHETLHEFIPKRYLPKDYDGDLAPVAEFQKLWEEKLASYEDYFQQQAHIKSDESKRKTKPNECTDDPYGCEGVFRKLDIYQ